MLFLTVHICFVPEAFLVVFSSVVVSLDISLHVLGLKY
jgi:hypothetical protein